MVPGRILDYEVVAITIREVPHEVHGQTGGLPRIVLGLERRVGELHRHREDGLAILRLRAAALRSAAHEAEHAKRQDTRKDEAAQNRACVTRFASTLPSLMVSDRGSWHSMVRNMGFDFTRSTLST